jgi:VanZ family protein
MFLATHLPVQRVMEQLPASDKHLHLGAYAVLGFALPWWSSGTIRKQHWRSQWHPWLLYALLLSYAAIDELLQIPVGRSAEWGDWLADAAGAAIGIAIGSFVARIR